MSYIAHKGGEVIPLQIQEKKLEDLFVRGAFSVFHALYDTDAINGTERIKLVVQAKNLSELFHTWITELLERAEIQNIACGEFRVSSIQKISDSKYLLTGIAYGESFDPQKHGGLKVKNISKIEIADNQTQETCSCEAVITLT